MLGVQNIPGRSHYSENIVSKTFKNGGMKGLPLLITYYYMVLKKPISIELKFFCQHFFCFIQKLKRHNRTTSILSILRKYRVTWFCFCAIEVIEHMDAQVNCKQLCEDKLLNNCASDENSANCDNCEKCVLSGHHQRILLKSAQIGKKGFKVHKRVHLGIIDILHNLRICTAQQHLP